MVPQKLFYCLIKVTVFFYNKRHYALLKQRFYAATSTDFIIFC